MIRLLALAALFASAPVFAQEDAADTAAPTEQFAPAPSKSFEKHGVDTTGLGYRVMRVPVELIGSGLAAVAITTGFTLGYCLVAPSDGWCAFSGIFYGGVLGMAVGAPLVTWSLGNLLDGTGSVWATLAAGAVGTAAGIGLVSTGNEYAIAAGLALPFVASVIAYEASSVFSRAELEAESRTSWIIAPSVGPKSAGVAFAMAF